MQTDLVSTTTDDSIIGPPDPSLPHHRNWQRFISLQAKQRNSERADSIERAEQAENEGGGRDCRIGDCRGRGRFLGVACD